MEKIVNKSSFMKMYRDEKQGLSEDDFIIELFAKVKSFWF